MNRSRMKRLRILVCLAVFGALGPWPPAIAGASAEVPARLADDAPTDRPGPANQPEVAAAASVAPEAPVWEPPPPQRADRVVLVKASRRLYLYDGPLLVRSYPVALGFEPEGPKRVQGDGRTPEGAYLLDYRQKQSDYHRSIHVSYPRPEDRARARERRRSPGGMIMIHGLPNGLGDIRADHTTVDWTDGCIAVTNEEMDEIWSLIDDDTPIHILP